MRYVLSKRIPPLDRILIVESGSREILDRLLPVIRKNNPGVQIDLVTCYPGQPSEVDGHVYRTSDYGGGAARWRMLGELTRQRYSNAGIICSGQPLMTKWKWAIACRLPAKVFLINENADYLYLDRAHWRNLIWLIKARVGFGGAAFAPTLARILVFPFALVYLLLFAAAVHTKRILRSL